MRKLASYGCEGLNKSERSMVLRFNAENGRFKILQVADMHFANGKTTTCSDVLTSQFPYCSDLNTTAFVERMIRAENPDLIFFTGDNIFGFDATDAEKSTEAAFAPAIASNIPWAAVLGNHDQEESTLSRRDLMKYIVKMKNTLSQREFLGEEKHQKESAPGLVFFHIPWPENTGFDSSNFTGAKQEGISSASVNSGFFTTIVEAGDVKAVFVGHDHVNDLCGELTGIHLCCVDGFGYHAYGKAGWARWARVVEIDLEKTEKGGWGTVKSIKT